MTPLDPYINQKSIINPKKQKVMAIYFAGYLSPIRNKLGNAVGRKWRTLDVLAVYNGRPRNPRTSAQQTQRAKFGFIATMARAFAPAVDLGFKAVCDGTPIPQRSMFIKKNIPLVDASDITSPVVDYTEVVIAEGGLPEASFGAASFADPLSVEVSMTDTSDTPGADARDKVYLFVYDPTSKSGILSAPKVRADEAVAVNVPATWNGHRVNAWGFAIGGGTDNMGVVSNSSYLGAGTIS